MAELTLEERITALEARVEQLAQRDNLAPTLPGAVDTDKPWWERIRGQFKDDPIYDEAMRLGREYRESLRPNDYKAF